MVVVMKAWSSASGEQHDLQNVSLGSVFDRMPWCGAPSSWFRQCDWKNQRYDNEEVGSVSMLAALVS